MPCWTRDCCRVCGWRVGLQSSGYYHAMAVVDTVRAAGDGSILIKCTLCQPPDTEWTHWTTLSVRCPDIRPRKPAPVHLPPGQQSPGHLPRGQDPLDISPWTCAIRSPDVRPLLTKAPQKRLNVMVMCLTIVTLSAGSKNTKILGAGVLRATVWGRDECPTFCQKNGDSVTRNIV